MVILRFPFTLPRIIIQLIYRHVCGSGSSVDIGTELRAGQSGIESRWRRDFPSVQNGPGAQLTSCKMGTGSFPGVECGRGVLLPTHLFWCRGHRRVELYLYPPSGPKRAGNGITLPLYTGCPRRNVPDFGRAFLMLKYTDITQNTYIQNWTVTEIMAREVWNFYSCYTIIDYQIHIKTGRNMLFL